MRSLWFVGPLSSHTPPPIVIDDVLPMAPFPRSVTQESGMLVGPTYGLCAARWNRLPPTRFSPPAPVIGPLSVNEAEPRAELPTVPLPSRLIVREVTQVLPTRIVPPLMLI